MTFNDLFNRYVFGYAAALLLLSDLPEVAMSTGAGSALYLGRALLDLALVVTALLSAAEKDSLIDNLFKDEDLAALRKSVTIPANVFALLVLAVGGFSALDHAWLTVTRTHFASLYFFLWLLADLVTLLLAWRAARGLFDKLIGGLEK